MKKEHHREKIVPRSNLDFQLDSNIPKYWLGGDPFKTRLFDGVAMTFPDGERYFISSVRAFKDQIQDPTLQQEIKDFTWQEGQHGKVHSDYNQILKDQGIPVDRMLSVAKRILRDRLEKHSPEYNVAMTAAFEHFTAMMAETFFERKTVMEKADPRMRAMFAWHAIEEMEHKSVAYDVMQKVAKVGYGLRSWTMLNAILAFNFHSLMITWYMLKHDGFSTRERLQMFQDNLPWLYGREGLYRRLMPGLLAYFKPGFHPWQTKTIHSYKTWLDTLEQTGSAMQAGQALYEAAY